MAGRVRSHPTIDLHRKLTNHRRVAHCGYWECRTSDDVPRQHICIRRNPYVFSTHCLCAGYHSNCSYAKPRHSKRND